MEPIKTFAIFKNQHKKEEKHPDYKISIKIGDVYVEAGGVWLKEGKAGKFMSCKLSDARDTRPGFRIETELPQIKSVAVNEVDNINPDEIPF